MLLLLFDYLTTGFKQGIGRPFGGVTGITLMTKLRHKRMKLTNLIKKWYTKADSLNKEALDYYRDGDKYSGAICEERALIWATAADELTYELKNNNSTKEQNESKS